MVETLRKRKKKVVRTKRRGGTLAFYDRTNINNLPIPEDISIMRLLLWFMFGPDAVVFNLPLPGELFYVGVPDDIDNWWVTIQSSCSQLRSPKEFGMLQQMISKGSNKEYTSESMGNDRNNDLFFKSLGNSILQYIVRVGLTSKSPLFRLYEDIKKLSKHNKINVNAKSGYSGLYDKIRKMTQSIRKDYGGNKFFENFVGLPWGSDNIVYAIPFKKVTEKEVEDGKISIEDYEKSQTIKSFQLKEIISARNEYGRDIMQSQLVEFLKATPNYSEMNQITNQFGTLILDTDDEIGRNYKFLNGAAIYIEEGYDFLKDVILGEVTNKKSSGLEEKLSSDTEVVEGDDASKGETRDDAGAETEVGSDVVAEVDSDVVAEVGPDVAEDEESPRVSDAETEVDDDDSSSFSPLEDSIEQPVLDKDKNKAIQTLKENYESLKEGDYSSNIVTNARNMVNMVFDDTIGGKDVKIIKNLIIIDKKLTIQKIGESTIKNIYKLDEAMGKFTKLSTKERIAKVRSLLEDQGEPEIIRIAVDSNPSKKTSKWMHVCMALTGESNSEVWVSVFTDKVGKYKKQRVSIKPVKKGGGRYLKRTRRKTLRKRYIAGGKVRDKLSFYSKKASGKAGEFKRWVTKKLNVGQVVSKLSDRIRGWTQTRLVDPYTIKLGWPARMGDTYLWLGNAPQYTKVDFLTNKEYATLGQITETYENTRKKTLLDEETKNRLPPHSSFLTIIGFGVDVEYSSKVTSEMNDTDRETYDKYRTRASTYGGLMKHPYVLSGSNDKDLIYDRISSRVVNTNEPNKYQWAFHKKYHDESPPENKPDPESEINGGGKKTKDSDGMENIEKYHSRESTPKNMCYYLVEAKLRKDYPSKVYKVYVDELELWGINSLRFSTLSKRFTRGARSFIGFESYQTRQEYIEKRFNKANSEWYREPHISEIPNLELPKVKKITGGVLTASQLQGISRRKNTSGEAEADTNYENTEMYGPKEVFHLLNKYEFIKGLPAHLYELVTHILIFDCKGETSEERLSDFKEKIANDNKFQFLRWPESSSHWEGTKHKILRLKSIKELLLVLGSVNETRDYPKIPPMFSNIKNITSKSRSEYTMILDKLINDNDKLLLSEAKKYEDIEQGGITKEILYNFLPSANTVHSEDLEGLGSYLKRCMEQGPIMKNMDDIDACGLNIGKWVEENNKLANSFCRTDRRTYLAIASLLDITPIKTLAENSGDKIFSLGYWIAMSSRWDPETKASGYQSLFFCEKHINNSVYNNSIDSYGKRANLSPNDIAREKALIKKSGEFSHTPIIFIVSDGNIYIPPTVFPLTDTSIKYIEETFQGSSWSVEVYKKNADDSTIDIRDYCSKFAEKIKTKVLLVVKNYELPETGSDATKGGGKFTKGNNVLFEQYNSDKEILPCSIRMLDKETMIPEINSLRKLDVEKMDSIHPIEKSQQTPINEIFGQMLKVGGVDFYDYNHLVNVLNLMKLIDNETGTSVFQGWKTLLKDLSGGRINIDSIKKMGRFQGGALFFPEKGNTTGPTSISAEIFKIIYTRCKNDISLFKEINNDNTFSNWKKNKLFGTRMVINPQTYNRLNNTLKIKMYNDNNLRNYSIVIDKLTRLKKLIEEVAAEKFEGTLDKAVTSALSFVRNTTQKVAEAKINQEIMGPTNQYVHYSIDGGSKTLRKMKKTGKKMKRTGKKLKRTGKKLRRTSKKIRRTNKK